MPRPKPPELPRKLQIKVPESEAVAVEAIVEAWGAALGAQGIHVVPNLTAWLRAKIREDAARYGVEIAASPPASSAAPKRAKPKR